ncbi:MAG: hypothetical protein KTM48_01455 [Wolbachia endosymbiont of Pissodes strobi]|nr:hypothetical protein [Wolbachia endosymbiont of Pissodes strobi]
MLAGFLSLSLSLSLLFSSWLSGRCLDTTQGHLGEKSGHRGNFTKY